MNIAIDGPSGAGKSTLAKLLAKELNIVYLDTGAMYRALAVKVNRKNFDCKKDKDKIENMLTKTTVDVRYDDGNMKILLDGKDVSDEIRKHYVSKLASDVSALPCVRLKLVELQRKIAEKSDSILDGRDIGTYVLPNAEHKFYLTASVEERAKRRYIELMERGEMCDLTKIKDDIATRDYNDTNREFAPLRQAEDAIVIDCTTLSIEEVKQTMLEYIRGEK